MPAQNTPTSNASPKTPAGTAYIIQGSGIVTTSGVTYNFEIFQQVNGVEADTE